MIPGADVSLQISTAGAEASGTSNMKFALNGALTIGTLDGANIEIKEEVGDDNIFIFGLRAEEIEMMREMRSYNPREYYDGNASVRRVLDALQSNRFCTDEPGLFTWIFDSLVGQDEYFHLADLPSYINMQEMVTREFQQPGLWARKAIINVARIGQFSSDRTVLEYARDIWEIETIQLP